MTDPTATAEALKAHARRYEKPILASWSGGKDIAEGEAVLNEAGVPTFLYPDTAAEAFAYMWKYTENLQALYETVSLPQDMRSDIDREAAVKIIQNARRAGRLLLTEEEFEGAAVSIRDPDRAHLCGWKRRGSSGKSRRTGLPGGTEIAL